MGRLSLYGKELRKLGYPETKNTISVAIQVMHKYYKHASKEEALNILADVLQHPAKYADDAVLQKVAAVLVPKAVPKYEEIPLSQKRKEYCVFGSEHIEQGAIHQMEVAMKLPIAVAGALMPDAHQGFGLPIGGVLATERSVIPYAVGVDIGCRMALSLFEVNEGYLVKHEKQLLRALESETKFGSGAEFKKPMDHAILESARFRETNILRSLHGKAARQIGTSGSGNHFVEFGLVTISSEDFELPPGKYLGLLSHSGSRGLGAGIADYYTRVAMDTCKLPAVARHFAWLDLDSQAGMEYWLAMNLAGDYASACHDQIHQKIAKLLGLRALTRIENHHNFAWKEQFEGKEVIVHRKGATPAGKGVLGMIPGSMVDPGYIVRGRGLEEAVNSASHGAGRKMSRSQAKNSITPSMMKSQLKKHGVTLLGGGIDEAPMAYKDIHTVMNSQKNLVDIAGTFQPKIVRMDG
jgi:tRNA-splicing ligase RtcB